MEGQTDAKSEIVIQIFDFKTFGLQDHLHVPGIRTYQASLLDIYFTSTLFSIQPFKSMNCVIQTIKIRRYKCFSRSFSKKNLVSIAEITSLYHRLFIPGIKLAEVGGSSGGQTSSGALAAYIACSGFMCLCLGFLAGMMVSVQLVR